ncbi:hypothetical protein [Halobaculum limi]|uniref:hypothetical protein n=1 Tax=Halobaculum limi TaxID=3031916 RepID=UPI002404E30A|nr:hypothetical protein [Halobaculum sp. YSMS11]
MTRDSFVRLASGVERVGSEPATLALVTVGYTAAVAVTLRYAPAYLLALGGGPVALGAFGLVVLGVPVVYPALSAEDTALSGSFPAVTPLALVAAFGLLVWLLAPGIGGVNGHVLPASAWVLLVAPLVAVWPTAGYDAGLRAIRAVIGSDAGGGGDTLVRIVSAASTARLARPMVLAFAFAVSALTDRVTVVVGLLLAVTVTVGLGVTMVSVALNGRGGRLRGDDRPSLAAPDRSARTLVGRLQTAPRPIRTALVADVAGGLSVAAFVAFAPVLVLAVRTPAERVLWLDVGPVAAFALLLGLEAVAAAVAPAAGEVLLAATSRRATLALGLLAGVVAPLALVEPTPTIATDAVAFGLYGTRRLADPARRRLVDSLDPELAVAYRLAQPAARALAVVPVTAAYALAPEFAFRLAAFVAAVGVYELYRRQIRAAIGRVARGVAE